MPYESLRPFFDDGSKSSTEPMEDNEVDDAEPVGDSSGVLALELREVEGTESTVVVLRMAPLWERAVVLILNAVVCVGVGLRVPCMFSVSEQHSRRVART